MKKFKECGLSKNVKNSEMRFIIQKKRKREEMGKETEFLIGDKLVPDSKIKRFAAHKNIEAIEEMLSLLIVSAPSYQR